MGWGPGNIGGSNPLSFEIKRFTSDADLLASTPKDNTIGIVTTTPISSWIFSAAQPEAPSEGMVWFKTGTSSDIAFNALKKNGIQVYPTLASQYISGVWADVLAMTGMDGEWVEWYKTIDFDLTTWTKKNPYPSRDYTQGTYDLSNKTLKGSVSGAYQHAVMVKNEKVDFSAGNKLKLVYSLDKDISASGSILIKASSSNVDPSDNTCVVNQQIDAMATNQEITIDVSSVNSEYYLWVGLAMWGGLGTVNFEISKLRLV